MQAKLGSSTNINMLPPESDDIQMLKSKYRAMDIEELRANIDDLEEENVLSTQLQTLYIAKNVLEIRFEEREEQIELLTKSLTSSSRIERWISSIKAIFK